MNAIDLKEHFFQKQVVLYVKGIENLVLMLRVEPLADQSKGVAYLKVDERHVPRLKSTVRRKVM